VEALQVQKFIVLLLALGPGLLAQERKVEPTWLHRDVSALREHRTDLTSNSCHFTPIFGEGDVESQVPQSVARFGELTVDAHGACQTIVYPLQEELYLVRDGRGVLLFGEGSHPLGPNDFAYMPPTIRHTVSNPFDHPLQIVVISVRIPPDTPISQPVKPEI
jgi:mannose-6-phosphate isomerase-like protein (cupin superfamily)